MSAPVIKPVDLKTGPQSFRSLAMPRWTPPGQQAIFNEKRMGQKKLGASGTDAFAKSVGFGVISAASIFVGSKFLPSILGVGLIGGGIIGLLVSLDGLFPSKESPGGVLPEGVNNKIPDQADFDMISGKFVSPKQYQSYLLTPAGKVALSNPSNKDVDVIVKVTQYKDDHPESGGRPNFKFIDDVLFKVVRVRTGGTEFVDFSPSSGGFYGAAVKLVLEKQRSAQDSPVKIAEIFYS